MAMRCLAWSVWLVTAIAVVLLVNTAKPVSSALCHVVETFDQDIRGNRLPSGTPIGSDTPMHYAAYAARRSQDNKHGSPFDDGMVFDARTTADKTRDLDLIQDPSRGNMLIIAKKRLDPANPDDNGEGGLITGTFQGPVKMVSIKLIDVEEGGARIRFFSGPSGSMTMIEEMFVSPGKDGEVRVVPTDVADVDRFTISITGSGALDDVTFIRPQTADLPCPSSLEITPEPPTFSPELAPTKAIATTCVPTTGPCVGSYDALSQVVVSAAAHDTITVCSGSKIETTSSLRISQANVTLCCERASADDRCVLLSTGKDRILTVSGDGGTFIGLVFRNGRGEKLGGGNVRIKSSGGEHRIIDSEFHGGFTSQQGGNLFIQTAGKVFIEGCLFSGGRASVNGGGIAIKNAEKMLVTRSKLVGNTAQYNGGGFFANAYDEEIAGQEIVLTDNEFTNNTAYWGGGFLATDMGRMPNLNGMVPSVIVKRNTFNGNVAEMNGGAGTIFRFDLLKLFKVTIQNNVGAGNVANDETYCNELSVFFNDSEDVCVSVSSDEEFAIVLSPQPTRAEQTPSPQSPEHRTLPPTLPVPTMPQITNTCVPTTGPCVASYDALSRAVDNAAADDIIAVCSGADIETTLPLDIDQRNVTLCCDTQSKDSCILKSSRGDRVLSVSGNGCTLSGLVFQDSGTSELEPFSQGGIVRIDSRGHHRIVDCEFHGGYAFEGGNLFVKTSGTVSIERSILSGGRAVSGGGGVAIVGAATVLVTGSKFIGNSADEGTGGGIYTTAYDQDPGQEVILTDNEFTANTAECGAGFLATDMGKIPSLTVLRNTFDRNVAKADGGAGSFQHLGSLKLPVSIFHNSGVGNVGFVEGFIPFSARCDGFLIQNNGQSACVGVDEEYVTTFTRAPTSPPPTPSPVVPTFPPTLPPITLRFGSCVPTTGPCVGSYKALSQVVGNAAADDIIAVCSGANIETAFPLDIDQRNVTLCCDTESTDKCILKSSTGDRVLSVSGDGCTLSGLVFQDGGSAESRSFADGGNVRIESSGHHRIVDCEFHGGHAFEGGNLFVKTSGTVLIERSILSGGRAVSGGGVAIVDAARVLVTRSKFIRNSADEGSGGGIYTTAYDQGPGRELILTHNEFTANTAGSGGGFLATDMGKIPNLTVLGNSFIASVASSDGGVGALYHHGSLDPEIWIGGNSGVGNVVIGGTSTRDGCAEFSIGAAQDVCVGVDEDYATIPTPSLEPAAEPPNPGSLPLTMPRLSNTCAPTTGPCVGSYNALLQAVESATADDIIAVCSGANIETIAPIAIAQPNVTLCCVTESREKCMLKSSTGDRVLSVSGDSCTLSGLVFQDGGAAESESFEFGGNVRIQSSGHHHVVGCEFHGGHAGEGANLFVKTAGTVLIERCILSGGRAGSGGGVAIVDARKTLISQNQFIGNFASTGGAIFIVTYDDDHPGQEMILTENEFSFNIAETGAGFLATSIGKMPSLTVLRNTFNANVANSNGGAGAVIHGTGGSRELAVTIDENSGSGNFAREDLVYQEHCDEFSIIDIGFQVCVGVDEEFNTSLTPLKM